MTLGATSTWWVVVLVTLPCHLLMVMFFIPRILGENRSGCDSYLRRFYESVPMILDLRVGDIPVLDPGNSVGVWVKVLGGDRSTVGCSEGINGF